MTTLITLRPSTGATGLARYVPPISGPTPTLSVTAQQTNAEPGAKVQSLPNLGSAGGTVNKSTGTEPTLTLDTGTAALRFNQTAGTDVFYRGGLPTVRTVVLVAAFHTLPASGIGHAFKASSGNANSVAIDSTGKIVIYSGTTVTTTLAPSLDKLHVISVAFDGAATRVRLDGVEQVVGTGTTYGVEAYFFQGANSKGSLAWGRVYDTVLSSAQLATIEADLAAFYGI